MYYKMECFEMVQLLLKNVQIKYEIKHLSSQWTRKIDSTEEKIRTLCQKNKTLLKQFTKPLINAKLHATQTNVKK